MRILASIAGKFFGFISRLSSVFHRMRYKNACVLAGDARLTLSSVIHNPQNNPNAISIGVRSQIAGQLHVFGHGGHIRIGSDSYVSEGSRIWSADSIVIGDRVLISHNVNIHDFNSHSLSARARHEHFRQIASGGHPTQLHDVPSAPIVIEDDAWIGFNASILKGVTIGRGAVVGAASVVTKDVAPYTIVVGNPARVIGESLA